MEDLTASSAEQPGRAPRPTLRTSTRHRLFEGGAVVYEVYLGTRWIGWVGDTRRFTGSRYIGRRWRAVWREEGDQHARWNTEVPHPNRSNAVTELVEQVLAGVDRRPAPDASAPPTVAGRTAAVRHALTRANRPDVVVRSILAPTAVMTTVFVAHVGDLSGVAAALRTLRWLRDVEVHEHDEGQSWVSATSPRDGSR